MFEVSDGFSVFIVVSPRYSGGKTSEGVLLLDSYDHGGLGEDNKRGRVGRIRLAWGKSYGRGPCTDSVSVALYQGSRRALSVVNPFMWLGALSLQLLAIQLALGVVLVGSDA
ncbi:hypothetical protein Tco_0409577 [Tanacetum coccineum]